jgi:hypothetical protein
MKLCYRCNSHVSGKVLENYYTQPETTTSIKPVETDDKRAVGPNSPIFIPYSLNAQSQPPNLKMVLILLQLG